MIYSSLKQEKNMETKWDLSFACDMEMINDHIRAKQIPFLESFSYQSEGGSLSGTIPIWRICWAGSEQYMGIEMELTDVTIKLADICENYPRIRSLVNIQYAFTEEAPDQLKFICKTEATSASDPTIGAIWVSETDMDASITNKILALAYPSLLKEMLIANEKQIDFVIAELNDELLRIEGLPVACSIPAFQHLNSKNVIAVLCMTGQTTDLPTRQFDTSLLGNHRFGYILKQNVLMERILLYQVPDILGLKSGSFLCTNDGCIVNNGKLTIRTIRVGAIDYDIKSDFFNLRFIGDVLDLTINGTCAITGLTDAYISYTFHAKRQGVFRNDGTPKVVFENIPGQDDEFHSEEHIPKWEEILAGIFTFGLFNLITELIMDAIADEAKKLFINLDLNGEMGGYGITWSNLDIPFTDGGFESNFFMRT